MNTNSRATMSSDTVLIASIAMHSRMGAPAANLDRVEEWTRRAHAEGARFALFPEECITGSLNKSDFRKDEAHGIADEAGEPSVLRLESLARELEMTLVVGTIAVDGERFRNEALIVGPAGHLATQGKLHLPNPTEQEWFNPADSFAVVASQGWSFAVGICFDLRFPELFRTAAHHGADFFLLPVGGSGRAEDIGPDGDQTEQARQHKKEAMDLLPSRAIDNGLYIFYANQAGYSGNAWFPGLALAIAPDGELIDEHLPEEGMIVTKVSRAVIESARSSPSCTVRQARPEVYATPVVVA